MQTYRHFGAAWEESALVKLLWFVYEFSLKLFSVHFEDKNAASAVLHYDAQKLTMFWCEQIKNHSYLSPEHQSQVMPRYPLWGFNPS